MLDNDEMIKKLKLNIAVSNFEDELNLDNEKKYTHKRIKIWRVYEMKKRIAIFITSILLVTGSVFACSQIFSGIAGDELSLAATYDGNGIVTIEVENKSDKVLNFQKDVKLMRWSDSTEITKNSDELKIDNTKFEPNSSGTMKIDISKVYDISKLEEPLENDHYYFVLTNNNFVFGNDWHCSVKFSKEETTNESTNIEVSKVNIENKETSNFKILNELKSFFDEYVIDPEQRNEKIFEYYEKARDIILREEGNGKNIIHTVNPFLLVKPTNDVIFDNRVPNELQYQLISENNSSIDAYNIPTGGSDMDDSLVLSVCVPQSKNEINETGGLPIPLVYIYQYDVNEINKDNTFIFVRGRLLDVKEIEDYKVYQDNKYVCYNFTEFFYDDLDTYLETYLNPYFKIGGSAYVDDGIRKRIKNLYDYYTDKENLNKLFYYHQ